MALLTGISMQRNDHHKFLHMLRISHLIVIFVLKRSSEMTSLAGLRALLGPPYNRIQFFRFRIHFCRKVPTLEVGAPNGKSWV